MRERYEYGAFGRHGPETVPHPEFGPGHESGLGFTPGFPPGFEPGFGPSLAAYDSSPVGAEPDPGYVAYDAFPIGSEPLTAPDLAVLGGHWDSEAELTQLLRESAQTEQLDPLVAETAPPPRLSQPPATHRRRRLRRLRGALRGGPRRTVSRAEVLSCLIAVLVAVIVAVVSVLGGMCAHEPLRQVVAPNVAHHLTMWWPVLIYGPWLAASLSIIRHAVHYQRAPHAWLVVVLFSGFSVALSVAHAQRTVGGIAVAALPAIAALTCFHQLVRQITLTRPPRRPAPAQHGAPRR
ncbi:hypothetical protein [Streptomyces sp. NPDC057702]|uniref:hypothetical protein n=1 Tax=unclassified Streptomyces TaxID=2593676 RepID=UPI0036A96FCB